ncbi:MAG: LUD domain-containing protein [Haloferacaceae archaeon]
MSRADRAAEIRRLLAAEGDAVRENTTGFNRGRYETTADLDDYGALKREAREIKEDAIERLPALIDELRDSVEANGGRVYVADDAADADRYVSRVVADAGAEQVVKSKSMTTEEIDLNGALESAGASVVETDLGEWVLQLAEEAPSHIIAPAIHRSRESIAALFAERFDPEDPPETAEELTAFARERLLAEIERADVGVTGANFLAADSGTMALITSEGNARKTVTVPDVHVAVAGIEKVVPTVADLAPFVELVARSGTGQEITSYVSLLTPPVDSPTLDFDAPDAPPGDPDDRAFHLVLVDNGRTAMREDPHLRETLYCVRCSACANSCANFQHVGGHAFGGETYSGGIATGWEAGVEGLDAAAGFNDLCTGCSRCVDACPVGIDIPWINAVVRDRLNRAGEGSLGFLVEGLTPDEEPGGIDPAKRLFGNADAVARAAGAAAPVSNWLADLSPVRRVAERLVGLDRRRELPTFERETLVEWAADREPPADPVREAVLYPDLYTNRMLVDRGRAAVRTLEALGVDVRVPAAPESGRAPLSQGMIASAERAADRTLDRLVPHVAAGRDAVVVEPSDLAMFRREYATLLPERADVGTLADGSYGLFEYLHGLLDNGAPADAIRSAPDGHPGVDYHPHCQGRTLGLAGHAVEVLERRGYDVRTTDAECCGMAGSFGYKREFYDLSVAVGESLVDELDPARVPVATGASCTAQLSDLLAGPARHPVDLVAPAPGGPARDRPDG